MFKAAIFVRVSKKEQDYRRQIEDLQAVASAQGMDVVAEICEKISGVCSNQEREGLQDLLALARNGQIQKVLVQEVSRLGRSTVEVLQVVEELTALGVSIYVENFSMETLKGKKRKDNCPKFLKTPLMPKPFFRISFCSKSWSISTITP